MAAVHVGIGVPCDIVTINVRKRIAITDDGRVCAITNLIDATGELTEVADDATVLVICVDEAHYVVVRVADYEPTTTQ